MSLYGLRKFELMWEVTPLACHLKAPSSQSKVMPMTASMFATSSTRLSAYDKNVATQRALDSKALIAWNEDTVVLAFRGTASLANLWADLHVNPIAHVHNCVHRCCAG